MLALEDVMRYLDLSEKKLDIIEGFLVEEWDDFLCFGKIIFDC